MPEERGHAAAQRGLTLFRPLHLANVVAPKLPLCYPTSICLWLPPCPERRLPTNTCVYWQSRYPPERHMMSANHWI